MSTPFTLTLASGNTVTASKFSVLITDPDATVLRTIDAARIRAISRDGASVTIATDSDSTMLSFPTIDDAGEFEDHLRETRPANAPPITSMASKVKRDRTIQNYVALGIVLIAISAFAIGTGTASALVLLIPVVVFVFLKWT